MAEKNDSIKSNTREPETLKEFGEQDYMKSIRENSVELYENEFELVKSTLNLPQKFMELGEFEQNIVLLYVDQEFVEPYSGKRTQGDVITSFLAAHENQSIVKKLYKKKEVVVGMDAEMNPIVQLSNPELDPQQLSLFLKVKKDAIRIWNKYNLKEIAKTMRQIVTNGGFRDEELLEQQIMADATSNERDNFTMQNRKLAVEIKGMRKPQGLQAVNVFIKGGGKEATEAIKNSSKNNVYDLIPDLEDVEIVEDDNDYEDEE